MLITEYTESTEGTRKLCGFPAWATVFRQGNPRTMKHDGLGGECKNKGKRLKNIGGTREKEESDLVTSIMICVVQNLIP